MKALEAEGRPPGALQRSSLPCHVLPLPVEVGRPQLQMERRLPLIHWETLTSRLGTMAGDPACSESRGRSSRSALEMLQSLWAGGRRREGA